MLKAKDTDQFTISARGKQTLLECGYDERGYTLPMQITEQANGLCSVYTNQGPDMSMADEVLLGFDLSMEDAEKLVKSRQ